MMEVLKDRRTKKKNLLAAGKYQKFEKDGATKNQWMAG